MELRRGQPGVTLAGVRTFLAIVVSFVGWLFVWAWLSAHDVRWEVATFDTVAWLAVATMGWRRFYPQLTDDDLAAIRSFQILCLVMAACGLLMSHLPAVRAAGRTDREFLIYAAQGAIYVGLAINFRPPLRQLPSLAHQCIAFIGMCSTLITLFSA